MNHRSIYISLTLLLHIGIISCDREKRTSDGTASVLSRDRILRDSVIQHIQEQHSTFLIQSSKASSLISRKGIRLAIPENAFVTAEGTIPSGKITITLSEYHNPADILISGIPMQYGKVQLESAGMFDVNAFADDKPLKLADGKEIKVRLPSVNPDADFNLYYFDKTTNEWKETQQRLAVTAIDTSVKPKKPVKKLKSYDLMTIEWSNAKAEERMVNGRAIKLVKPECVGLEEYSNTLPVNSNEFPELGVYQEPVWIPVSYKDSEHIQNTFKTDTLLSASIVERETPFNKYLIAFTFRNSTFPAYMKVASKPGWCIINAERYDALYEQRPVNEKRIEALQQKEKKASKESALFRSFSINTLGLWNCDRLYLMAKRAIIHPTFRDASTQESLKTNVIYLIDQNINSVWTYSNTITLNPDSNNLLVFINAAGRLCYARVNRLSDMKTEHELSLIIDVTVSEETPDTTDELSVLLKDASSDTR